MSDFLQERIEYLRHEASVAADKYDDCHKKDRWEWRLADEIERLRFRRVSLITDEADALYAEYDEDGLYALVKYEEHRALLANESEAERLRELVESAYAEGHKAGHIERGQHPGSSWYMSDARRALDEKSPRTPRHREGK